MSDPIASAEPEALRCAAHPAVETYLRCGRCDKPICPRCLIQTPVGGRCHECARLRRLPIYDVSPRVLLQGTGGGLVAATLGGMLIHFLPNFGLLMLLLLGAAYGYLVAGAVSLTTNRKRGASLGWATIFALFLGFGLSRSVLAFFQFAGSADSIRLARALMAGFNPDLGSLALMAVAALVAYNRLR